MEKILPILSDSLRAIVREVKSVYEDPIATEICEIDDLVEIQDFIVPDNIKKRLKNEVRMLSGRYGENFEISFLPYDKKPEYTEDGKWKRSNRQTGKPTRIFQKLISKQFDNRTWEVFNNRLRACMCKCENFSIVEGEDIRTYYNEDNYYSCSGTLGNSCMRYSHCSSYFDLYVDKAKLLISSKNGSITGRAIVWEINGITIMDRVYTCMDYLENCFYEYAKSKGWWIRPNNSLLSDGDEQLWLTPDDEYSTPVSKQFIIHVPDYDQWPYVDSLRYYNDDYGYITNIPIEDGCCRCLSNTEGYAGDSGELYECEQCGATFRVFDGELPDELHYSEEYNAYYCDDCCWWCDELNDWFPNFDECIIVHDGSNTIEYPKSYIDRYPSEFVLVDNEWYNNKKD